MNCELIQTFIPLPSYILHHPSSIIPQPSYFFLLPSYIILHPSSLSLLTSSFLHHTSSHALFPYPRQGIGKVLARTWQAQASYLSLPTPCHILACYLRSPCHILAKTTPTSSLSHHPSALFPLTSSFSPLPSYIIHQPSSFSPLPSYILHQPSSLSLRCQQERSDDSEFSKPAAMRQLVPDDIVT